MKNSVRFEVLDFMKFLACILVVFIHCQFPGGFGIGLRTIARTAVPFFLMVSGYFSVNSANIITTDSLKKKIYHILRLMWFSYMFYAVYYIAKNLSYFSFDIISLISDYIRNFNLLKFLITNAPTYYLHLWFLGALLYCYILLYPSLLRTLFFQKQFLLLCIFLFTTIFILSSEILPFFDIELSIVGFKLQHIFLFRGMSFFLIGLYIRLYKPCNNVKPNYLLMLALAFLLISLIERCIQVEDSQAYIGSIICSTLILMYCVRSNITVPKQIVFGGAELSLYIYVYHISMIPIARVISPNNWITPIIVVILSFAMAAFTYKIKCLYLSTTKVVK